MLRLHAKKCDIPHCKLTMKQMQKFEVLDLIQKERRVNVFLAQKLKIELESVKKDGDQKRLEKFVFKYVTYMLNSGMNASKTLFEIQKIIFHFLNSSLFFF